MRELSNWADLDFRGGDAHIAFTRTGGALVSTLVGEANIVEERGLDSILDDSVVDTISDNPRHVGVIGWGLQCHLMLKRDTFGTIIATGDFCRNFIGDFGRASAGID